MSDFIWFILIGALFALLSCLFIVLGCLIWIKQKMNLIISHHCDKVSEENKQAYCRIFGIGMLVIGLGLGLSGISAVLLQSAFALIPMSIGLVSGIVLLIIAVAKYNR